MSTALNTLLEHAEKQRDDAMGALLRAEEGTRRLQQQALQLHSYRDEYQLRAPGRGGHSVSIELLRSHHEFMQRLEQALQQQKGQLQTAEEGLAQRRADLLALETRVASVRKLMERRSLEEIKLGARQDQRRSDDTAHRALRSDGSRGGPWTTSTDMAPLAH